MIATLGVGLLSIAIPASAADDETPATDEIVLPPDDIERIRIVGERTTRPGLEPVAVETEVIDRAKIEALPAVDAPSIIRTLPGIRVQSRVQGELAAVSIEGLPPTYTAVRVDGERYAGEIGGVDDLREFPLANVGRIEVLRGPQGLRFGPEAAGGVVNLITEPVPLYAPKLGFEFGGGDDKAEQAKGAVGVGRNGLGAVLAVDYDQLGGYDAPHHTDGRVFIPPDEDSTRRSIDLYGRSAWLPIGALALDARFGWRKRDEDFAGEGVDAEESVRDNERWFVGAGGDWQLDPARFVEASVNYYRSTTTSTVGRDFDLSDDEVKLELAGEQTVDLGSTRNTLMLGVDLRRQSLDLTEAEVDDEIAAEVGTRDAEEAQSQAGLFLIADTELNEIVQAEYGVRAQLHSRYSAKLVPQVALLVTPLRWGYDEEVRLRFSYGRNHRYPSLRDLYQPATPQNQGSYFLAGNDSLRVERANSFRAGIEVDPHPAVTISLVAFHNDIEDHIRSAFLGRSILVNRNVIPPNDFLCNNGAPEFCEEQMTGDRRSVFEKQNLDKVRTRGFEARLYIEPHERIEIDLGYTFMDTRVRDSNVQFDELPNEPRHVVNARLTMTAPVSETLVTAQTRWRSSAVIEGSGTGLVSFSTADRSIPSLHLDLRVAQPLFERFELYADVRNATNNRFEDSYIVRGRTFFVGARADLF